MLNKYFVSEQKEFNDNDRTLVAWATTDDVDRDGESLSADGWDLKAFRKNSVLMACHDYQRFPVGKVIWIKPDPSDNPKGLKFKAQFAETDEGLDAWYLYRNGFMSAFSVGFNPLEDPIYDDKADGKKKPRRRYCKNELLEISCVPVPANAMALIEAEKGIKTKAFKEMIEDIVKNNEPEQEPNFTDIMSKLNDIDNRLATIEKTEKTTSDWDTFISDDNIEVDLDEIEVETDALGDAGDVSDLILVETSGRAGDDADSEIIIT